MVVLQINKFFWPKGGAERYFFMVSDELEKRGHRVVHFSMDHPENVPSPYAEYFVSRRDYETPGGAARALRQAASFIRSREAARNVGRLVRDHRPDVAHLHNIYHQLTPSIIEVLADAGVPVVMTLHDYKLICPNYYLFSGGRYCYRCRGGRYHHAALERCREGSLARSALLAAEAYWQKWTRVYGRVARFVAPSRFLHDRIVEASRSTGIDAGRVVYVPSFLPAVEADAALDPGEEAVLETLPRDYALYFGRLSTEKGLDTLLDAAGRLPDVPFVLCGDGPQRAAVESRVAREKLDNVSLTGYVRKPLLDRIVTQSLCVVLPSLCTENAPFTAIEAAAAGAPVIVSDMGGMPEIAEVVSGRVFPHGDAGDLAAAIQSLRSDPVAARESGRAGREAARAYFDKARHMEALERIYREVANR